MQRIASSCCLIQGLAIKGWVLYGIGGFQLDLGDCLILWPKRSRAMYDFLVFLYPLNMGMLLLVFCPLVGGIYAKLAGWMRMHDLSVEYLAGRNAGNISRRGSGQIHQDMLKTFSKLVNFSFKLQTLLRKSQICDNPHVCKPKEALNPHTHSKISGKHTEAFIKRHWTS